jgi:hypothetical protein
VSGALADALRGDLEGWSGLGDDVTPETLSALAESEGPAAGTGRLSGMPVRFRHYDGPLGPVTAWFDDHDLAFLLWADRPLLVQGGAAALEALGEPEARLDDSPSRFPGTTQWVWPGRGVTLYVQRADAPTGSNPVRALALFRPGTLDFYTAWLGADEGPPYLPRPGGPPS